MGDLLRSRLEVLGAALFFSTGGVAIKLTSLSGLEVAFGRSLVAAVVLWLLLPGWRRFWDVRSLGVGVFYAATLVCFVVATKYTLAANAIFLQSTAPIYVLLLSPILLREPNQRSDYLVTLVLAIGLACFFLGVDDASVTAPDPGLGNAFAIVSGFCLALMLMGLRWLGRDGGAGTGSAALAGNVIAAVACLPLVWPIPAVGPQDAGLIVFLGAVQIGLGYWMLTRGIAGVPAVEVAMLLLAEPVLSAVWAWIVLGEQPGAWALAGCTLILLATTARVAIHRTRAVHLD
jgi:drug/metabolite transporter (DMT)-like permease